MDFEQDCGLVFTEIGGIFIENIEKTQENMKKTSRKVNEKGTFIVENLNCVEV
jgi:hypothetical protein